MKMGSAGDSPASIGDPPIGTVARNDTKRPASLVRSVVSVPSGESPDGTGGSPVLPTTIRDAFQFLHPFGLREGASESREPMDVFFHAADEEERVPARRD